LLVQLDDTVQQAQLQQAEAQTAIARTNLQRSRELAGQNFVSQSAVDQNAAALDVAQAQVALVQAQLSRMRIVAPFDAVAGIRSVQVGDYLKDGADIVTLDDVGSVYLDFRLPERHVPQVKPGKVVEAQIDALPGRRFSGIVTALDSQVDTNGRALLVRAELRNADGALRPGMFARARVVFGALDKAILVPEESLVPLNGAHFVYKVIEGPNGPVSKKLTAKIGLRQLGQVQILEGLEAGDLVVTAGHGRLARGDNLPLRVIELGKPATSARPASGPMAAAAAASATNKPAP
jgi:membrane fusion protein (multidrug efflux system)